MARAHLIMPTRTLEYITLRGKASVSQERSKIKELWNAMYKAWFPKGKDDPEIAVLRVDISDGDYCEASSSKIVLASATSLRRNRRVCGGRRRRAHCV